MSKPLSLEEFFRNFETHVSQIASNSGSMHTDIIWDLPANSIASSSKLESAKLLLEACIDRQKQYSDLTKQESVIKKLNTLRNLISANYNAESTNIVTDQVEVDLYLLDNCIRAVKNKITLSHYGLIILNKLHEKYT